MPQLDHHRGQPSGPSADRQQLSSPCTAFVSPEPHPCVSLTTRRHPTPLPLPHLTSRNPSSSALAARRAKGGLRSARGSHMKVLPGNAGRFATCRLVGGKAGRSASLEVALPVETAEFSVDDAGRAALLQPWCDSRAEHCGTRAARRRSRKLPRPKGRSFVG